LSAAIGELIRTADTGNGAAVNQLFTSLYAELHAIAERRLRLGGPELTLGTTTLLHEAYLNISSREGVSFPDRGRFLGYASRAMRGLIIDYVRSRRAKKRGGEFQITFAGAEDAPAEETPGSPPLEQLGEALETLSQVDPALAELVDLHFFAGFSLVEIAELRGVSERTAQRDWRRARLLLYRSLDDGTAMGDR
jgi:RNA polymerase sigma factor (TIGR02999 family)